MTKKIFLLIFGFFSAASSISAQDVTYDKIKKEYESFEYERVIQLSGNFLKQTGLESIVKIDVHFMRAISFYSIAVEDSAISNFLEILKINKNYNPDPQNVSPKIILLFNQVKSDYLKSIEPPPVVSDSLRQILNSPEYIREQMKISIIKNIALPGLGQIHKGDTPKGYILSAASGLNLAAMVYFIIDANKKSDLYLNETDENLIRERYDDYNRAYKTRNILIASYALIWVYSQLDLLLFNNTPNESEASIPDELAMNLQRNNIWLSYKFRL
ncbi:MAG: hypothetical protein AB1521_03980 [Bacteroidota bacterium]